MFHVNNNPRTRTLAVLAVAALAGCAADTTNQASNKPPAALEPVALGVPKEGALTVVPNGTWQFVSPAGDGCAEVQVAGEGELRSWVFYKNPRASCSGDYESFLVAGRLAAGREFRVGDASGKVLDVEEDKFVIQYISESGAKQPKATFQRAGG